MKRMRELVALTAILVAGSTLAQDADFRPNPFTPPASEQEKQLVQDERTRNIVRGMQSEIVDKVAIRFERKIDTMEQSLKQKVDEAVKSATSNLAPSDAVVGDQNSKETETAKSLVPEGATFVACVNKKALYRDKDNTLIQDASDGNRCVAP